MSDKPTEKKIIGRAEKIDLPELGIEHTPARIDTGAKTSALWASDVSVADGVLSAVLFGEQSDLYTGERLRFTEFDETIVSTSTGELQRRYKVRLLVKLKGKKVRAWFTLADRSTQVYPVLIGRNVLLGKFVVDVKQGRALKEAEQQRTDDLRSLLNNTEEQA
jgi:hypothetical protein